MKNLLKRSLSIVLAVTIIFSSALIGLREVDYSKISLRNPFGNLTVKTQAASSGTCGTNVRWTLDGNGTLTISGTGDMTDYFYSSLPVPWVSSSANIKTIIIKSGVTSISSFAFSDCTNLTAVTLPDSLMCINEGAFDNCISLTSINIPDSVTHIVGGAFSRCTSLTSITIPDSVTGIDSEVFLRCENLTSITIPASVKYISESAFCRCTSLEYVFYKGSQEQWNAIEIGYENEDLKNAIIHYNSVFHNGSWIIDVKATCTKTGSKHRECAVCGIAFGTTEIPATGHVLSGWITVKNPTAENLGQKYKQCNNCDYIEFSIIPQLKCSKPKLKTIANTATGVKITWGKVTGADSYEVYRKVKGGSYSKVGTTSKTYFTDKKAKSGKQYYYVVKAVNEAGKSENSNYKSIKFLADPTLKTPTSTKSGITLKWSKVTGA